MALKPLEKKLAQISEDENFNKKNRFLLQKQKLNFIEKKRTPIDASKVKDLLRNQGEFRDTIKSEVGTYDEF